MVGRVAAVWHGQTEDLRALVAAVQTNCECVVPSVENPAPPVCSAHQLLLDQRTLDHFAFVNANLDRYLSSEFDLTAEWF